LTDAQPPGQTPERFFEGSELGLATYRRVLAVLERIGPVEVRVMKSQVAFRLGGRGVAYLWRPRQYLGDRGAEVVVSIALERRDSSPRWKEVAHPTPRVWMHHLELRSVHDIDEEVSAWLLEAAER
jgi:hypothetical protein